MKAICVAVLTASLAAGCGAATTTQDAATTPPTTTVAAGLPDVARIACDDTGARVLTPRVRPQRDGIHLRFENEGGRPLDYSVESDAAGQGGSLPEEGAGLVAALPPGRLGVSCTDPASTADPSDAKRVTIHVEDPDGLFTPSEPQGGCSRVARNIDYMAGARGERGSPVNAARRYLVQRKLLKDGDGVVRAGYPEQTAAAVALARKGLTVAVLQYEPDGHGGWNLAMIDACAGFGFG